jgi:beta-barrel assembly-enhancing protease
VKHSALGSGLVRLSAFAFALLAFATPFVVATSGAAVDLVSIEEEIEIGRSANEQMRSQVPELHDPMVTSYVRDIGRRLVRAAPGTKYPYSFSIADSPEINAFSLPGGPVWLHRGVLAKAQNESQVAAVLAHEVAHIAQRHGADRLTQGMVAKWGLGLLGALLGNTGGAGTAQAAATLLTGGVFLKFSRNEEREADQVGVMILTRSGWAGRGMVDLFALLEREADRDHQRVDAFLASHPSPQDRIASLSAQVASQRGGTRDSARYQSIKAHLARLPASRPRDNR